MFNTLNTIKGLFVPTPAFSLETLPDFPADDYNAQLQVYQEQETWFTGEALNETRSNTAGKPVEVYPMHINPIITTVLKHAYILFGEVENDGRPLVVPKLLPAGPESDAAEEPLNMVWWENHGRAVMIENAILSQIYGGCFFKSTYVPWETWRSIPIRIELLNPKFVVGYPDASDMYRLSEAWIAYEITQQQAVHWGYEPTGNDLSYWYTEHWLRDVYEVRINNQAASVDIGGTKYPLGGENPWEEVPIVYFPHIRVGEFIGRNAFDHLKGLVKELNLRYGDYGDAINDDSHPIIAIRNVNGSVQVKRINEWLEVVDLGNSQGISGQEPEPDMLEVRTPRASTAMNSLVQEIYNQYRRDSFVPAIAEGEDEGSQRSGMTLAMRFWALLSHTNMERYFWTAGLDVLERMLLKMMFTKGLGSITEKHTKMRIKQVWAPNLPRDRETDVQEWVQRASTNLGSIEHLLELTGDVENIPVERKQILQWVKDLAIIQAEVQAKFAPPPTVVNNLSSNKEPSKKTPAK